MMTFFLYLIVTMAAGFIVGNVFIFALISFVGKPEIVVPSNFTTLNDDTYYHEHEMMRDGAGHTKCVATDNCFYAR